MNETQYFGEHIVASYLELLGHIILARNKRFGPLEADIISSYSGRMYITEVRTVTKLHSDLSEVFPQLKILTLLRLVERQENKATLLCFLVCKRNGQTTIRKINPYQFL